MRVYLTLMGCKVSDLSQGYRPGGGRHSSTRQTAGIPDLYCQDLKRGGTFWIEVKRPGGKISPHQAAWILDEWRSGGAAYVVTSAAEAQAILQRRRA